MIAILTDKPNVGREIARVVGAHKKENGYMTGGGYMVTWTFGNMLSLAMPKDSGKARVEWEDFPLVPPPYLTVKNMKTDTGWNPDINAVLQLKVIAKVFDACDTIIAATDASREGEMLFRHLYRFLGCKQPCLRLWISSLTDEAILEGMANLRPCHQFDNLFLAADSRNRADWMLGVNSSYTRKQLDALTEFVKKPQIGAKGMVYARVEADGTVKSSVDKFYTQEVLQEMKAAFGAKPGDLILILSGDDAMKTRKQLNELRLEMGNQLGLRDKNKFALLWIVDFPMFEWSEEEGRLMAMHHPFTHPKDEDIPLLDTNPAAVRADAYDMVCNGIEVGGGSIRIHDAQLQAKMFEILGFTPEKAEEQFGFLMNAFKFGAPPHGGLAYGLDRWVSIFAGLDSIRDCIAFPKNNSGRDVMLDAPSAIDQKQLDELNLIVEVKE